MTFESIMGSTLETKILDLIIPLSENTQFDVENVTVGLTGNIHRTKIRKVLDGFVTRKLLLKKEVSNDGFGGNVYLKNKDSNQAWALNNLLHSIYTDKLRADSMKKMGITEKSK